MRFTELNFFLSSFAKIGMEWKVVPCNTENVNYLELIVCDGSDERLHCCISITNVRYPTVTLSLLPPSKALWQTV